jgi:hypothetical protein
MIRRAAIGLLALGVTAAPLAAAGPAPPGPFAKPALVLRLAEPAGTATFRRNVAISADGGTALIEGGPDGAGYVWVYVRSGSTWREQAKLTSPNGTGAPFGPMKGTFATSRNFGAALAISADGNTALITEATTFHISGGLAPQVPGARATAAARAQYSDPVWVFVRTGLTWTNQGALHPNDEVTDFTSGFGRAVALSADGNTALVGGPDDGPQLPVTGTYTRNPGAAWVFVRNGSTWTQQEPKLTPTDGSPPDEFGSSVALSADGSTALIGSVRGNVGGGPGGAAVVFARSGSEWSEQAKLVGSGATADDPNQWYRVALSGDGNTALVGGNGQEDSSSDLGGAWIFTRSGTAWAQLGPELVAASTDRFFGAQVALSEDGDTALIGGLAGPRIDLNHGSPGGMWVYKATPSGWAPTGASVVVGGDFHGQTLAVSGDGSIALAGSQVFGGPSPVTVFGPVVFSQLVPYAPAISALTPRSGPAGAAVRISGRNLKRARAVRFGASGAAFTVASATTIRAKVPAAARPGAIGVTVVTPNGTATARFVVTR